MLSEFQKPMESEEYAKGTSEEIIVFVYGTLMKGKSNNGAYMSGAELLGRAVVEDFELYHLGGYPGIVEGKGGRVKGEIYRVDSDTLERLDELEEEGTLYKRRRTRAALEDGSYVDSWIYIYNQSVSGRAKVEFEDQPWGSGEKKEYVWYATYGSNLLYERFLHYIQGGSCRFNGRDYEGCRNKSLPRDSKPVTIPYNMYFGNKRSAWGEGGVSFLDLSRPGKALGRMYLIEKQQFEDVARQEGQTRNWYNESVTIGEHEGVKIVTFTNSSRREACPPPDSYIDVIMKGLKETYPEMSTMDIMKYLVGCSGN